MLFRGRDHSAWAQDLKPIPMLLGHGASQVEWGEHEKADRDSPESCGWRRGIGSRRESGGGRRNGDIPARRWRTPDASTGTRTSFAARGAAGRTLRLPAGGNNPKARHRRGERRERPRNAISRPGQARRDNGRGECGVGANEFQGLQDDVCRSIGPGALETIGEAAVRPGGQTLVARGGRAV